MFKYNSFADFLFRIIVSVSMCKVPFPSWREEERPALGWPGGGPKLLWLKVLRREGDGRAYRWRLWSQLEVGCCLPESAQDRFLERFEEFRGPWEPGRFSLALAFVDAAHAKRTVAVPLLQALAQPFLPCLPPSPEARLNGPATDLSSPAAPKPD